MIWCVEDDASIRDIEIYALDSAGFETRGFEDGSLCWEALKTEKPELILLDVMLPGMDGLSVLKELRQKEISTPVILLTAKSDVSDIITGLDAGSDDYLAKPFSGGELLARIRAILRRGSHYSGEILHFEDLTLNKGTMTLSSTKDTIRLGLKESQIMELLSKNPGQVIPKSLLIERVWGIDSNAEYNNIEVYISFLRQKLGSLGTDVQIRTIRGVGYQLEVSL